MFFFILLIFIIFSNSLVPVEGLDDVITEVADQLKQNRTLEKEKEKEDKKKSGQTADENKRHLQRDEQKMKEENPDENEEGGDDPSKILL